VGTTQRKPHLRKRINYVCGRRAIAFGLKLAELFPIQYFNALAGIIGIIGFYLMRKYRTIVKNNLQIAFGTSKTQKEYGDIGKTVFRDTVKNMLEVAKVYYTDPSLAKELVSIDGLEHLENVLSKGKGAVAVSAHMGNFPLIGPRLILEGYHFSLILREPKDSILGKTLSDLRESIPVNPRKVCVAQSLASLSRNGILFLQIDQNASSKDLWVDFFGWMVPTFRGPVVFSMRTGAPLIPLFIIRDALDHHKLIIKAPLALDRTDNKEKDILHNTAKLTKLIECYIREYPSQWWWFHRRWKKARKSN
jgi:KDO2-lipid IV(A) lauroyltransferase